MSGIVIAQRCQGPCGRQVAAHTLTPFGPHVRICEDCRSRHYEALELLSKGKTPKECGRCQRSMAHETSMEIHLLDGIYVGICQFCTAHIEQLHRHMYRDTPHGATIQ